MKTIVITGASRGIGLATATRFLEEGWQVVGTYNKTRIPIENANCIGVQLDQGDTPSIKRAVEEIKQKAYQIDVLINNAGITLDWVEPQIDLDKIRKTFEVNLFGVINLTEQLLPKMPTSSHIVNIDSSYGAFSLSLHDESS